MIAADDKSDDRSKADDSYKSSDETCSYRAGGNDRSDLIYEESYGKSRCKLQSDGAPEPLGGFHL